MSAVLIPTAADLDDRAKRLNSPSWVIRRKATGVVLFETFSATVADAINRASYDVIPIMEYLQGLNGKGGAE